MFSALGAIWIVRTYGFITAVWFAVGVGILETTDYIVEQYTGSKVIEHVIDRLTLPHG